jgi:hypothetical protein
LPAFVPAFVPAFLLCAGCGAAATATVPPDVRHRAALLRAGGLFVQVRVAAVRAAMPAVEEILTLAATPAFPGASCLFSLLGSADLVSVFAPTRGGTSSVPDGLALVEGEGIPADRVGVWTDCVLGGLGSGRIASEVAVPAVAVGEAAAIRFTTGTGPWARLGIAALVPGRYLLVSDGAFERAVLQVRGGEAVADPPEGAWAETVAGADVQATWTDPDAVSGLLAAVAADLGPSPPADLLDGLAAGLWLGDDSRIEIRVHARSAAGAQAAFGSLRTAVTVVELSASVLAARLGLDYGPEVQARAEAAARILRRAELQVVDLDALLRIRFEPGDLEVLQRLGLAYAGLAMER